MQKILMTPLFLLALTPPSYADSIMDQTIRVVHISFDTGIYFQTNEKMVDPDNCGSTNWYRIEKGNTYEKEAYSLLLAGHTSGKLVNIGLNGCAGESPRITWINIHD
ncbi:hypothetical protein GCM10008940_02220 [Microbulbifer agarilyticus]